MREKVLKIVLCLISILIIMPSDVKAMERVGIHNNEIYILANADQWLEHQTTFAPTVQYVQEEESKVCSDELRAMLNNAWKIIIIFAPALLILMTSIDFFKAITSADSDKLKKSSSDALKRTLAFVLLILLKFILSTVFGWVGLDLCL